MLGILSQIIMTRRLFCADITEFQADALIYSTNVQLMLSGGVGGSLLFRYGDSFRNELFRAFNSTGRKLAEVGEVFSVTHEGCPWKVVFHTIATDPLYHTDPSIVRRILMRCFDECLERGDIRSIVISMLGTGYGDLSIERFLELTTEISNLSQYEGIENITICCDHPPFLVALLAHTEKANLGWKLQSEQDG
jgi:O-acetyl-ADP-ribose deacetylase (regulator of RNase III)